MAENKTKKTTSSSTKKSTASKKKTTSKATVEKKKTTAKPATRKKAVPKPKAKSTTAKKTTDPKKRSTSASGSNAKQTTKQKTESGQEKSNKDFISQASEVFEEKAKIAREKTKDFADDFADKSSVWSKDILGKIKKGINVANEAVSKFAEKAGDSVQEYTDRYKLQAEIRKFKKEQIEDLTRIGSTLYDLYDQLPKTSKVYKNERIAGLYEEIKQRENRLNDLNEQLNMMIDEEE